jgi:hypothetical protein
MRKGIDTVVRKSLIAFIESSIDLQLVSTARWLDLARGHLSTLGPLPVTPTDPQLKNLLNNFKQKVRAQHVGDPNPFRAFRGAGKLS